MCVTAQRVSLAGDVTLLEVPVKPIPASIMEPASKWMECTSANVWRDSRDSTVMWNAMSVSPVPVKMEAAASMK